MNGNGRGLRWGLVVLAGAALACGGGGGGGGTMHTLTVSMSGSGSGTITASPSGINCGSACSAAYSSTTSVTLTATPAAGSLFGGWSGVCTGTGACVVAMDAEKTVTASFPLDHFRPAKSAQRVWYHPGIGGAFNVVAAYNDLVFQANGDPLTDLWSDANHQGVGCWWQKTSTYGYNLSGPGGDGKWCDGDDVIDSIQSFGAVSGSTATDVVYDTAGGDGDWTTYGDDAKFESYVRTLDATGAEVRRVTYDATDAVTGWWTATYSGGNNRWNSWDRQVVYSAPGGDGFWLTADDVVETCKIHEFGEDSEYFTTETWYDPGPGGKCFDGDDVKTGVVRATNTY